MISVAHLLDDFGMGGVTRALTLFDNPELASRGTSQIVPVDPSAQLAPSLQADLIVDHMALSWRRIAFLLSLRARNPHARIVHVEHSYTSGFEAAQVDSRKRFRAMLKLASRLLDQFICVSEAQRRWMAEDVGVPTHKLQTIHPWSGRFELNAVPAISMRRNRPLRLLAYGRFADCKNFEALVIAMQSLSADKAQLTLFGDGPNRVVLAKLAEPLSHVKVDGPAQDVSAYLADCDAVIVPSRTEAFGLVATEARLAGRALIVADVDGLPEQVGSAGLVASLASPLEIVTAIKWAMRAPLAEMGQAGRRDVALQHDEIIAGWIDVYELAGAKVIGRTEKSRTVAA